MALAFLDADIDLTTNGYANEFGTFISLALPPGAAAGAIAPTSWEIDEPGYVFGDIYHNLYAGALDNTNSVPSTAPDDVSMALGFSVGPMLPGDSSTITVYVSAANIGGLEQTDPASPLSIYYNGIIEPPPPATAVPAVNAFTLVLLGLLLAAGALLALRRFRTE